jgi:hypothetical protein
VLKAAITDPHGEICLSGKRLARKLRILRSPETANRSKSQDDDEAVKRCTCSTIYNPTIICVTPGARSGDICAQVYGEIARELASRGA